MKDGHDKNYKYDPDKDAAPPPELMRDLSQVLDVIQGHLNEARAKIAAGVPVELMFTARGTEENTDRACFLNMTSVHTMMGAAHKILSLLPQGAQAEVILRVTKEHASGMSAIDMSKLPPELRELMSKIDKHLGIKPDDNGQEGFDLEKIPTTTKH